MNALMSITPTTPTIWYPDRAPYPPPNPGALLGSRASGQRPPGSTPCAAPSDAWPPGWIRGLRWNGFFDDLEALEWFRQVPVEALGRQRERLGKRGDENDGQVGSSRRAWVMTSPPCMRGRFLSTMSRSAPCTFNNPSVFSPEPAVSTTLGPTRSSTFFTSSTTSGWSSTTRIRLARPTSGSSARGGANRSVTGAQDVENAEGLGHVAEHAQIFRRALGLGRGEAGDDDGLQLGVGGAGPTQQLEAVDARQVLVGDDDVEGSRGVSCSRPCSPVSTMSTVWPARVSTRSSSSRADLSSSMTRMRPGTRAVDGEAALNFGGAA